jgi:hypothetical protein
LFDEKGSSACRKCRLASGSGSGERIEDEPLWRREEVHEVCHQLHGLCGQVTPRISHFRDQKEAVVIAQLGLECDQIGRPPAVLVRFEGRALAHVGVQPVFVDAGASPAARAQRTHSACPLAIGLAHVR